MNIPIGNIVSASDIQKNYRKIFDKARRTKEPILVLRGNEPDVAVIDAKTLEEKDRRLEELEIEDTLRAVEEGRREFREGKTIKAKSLADLF